jgi:hypothetical protein
MKVAAWMECREKKYSVVSHFLVHEGHPTDKSVPALFVKESKCQLIE